MSVERAFELLSAAADSVLTAAEQAELDELLRDLPEARELQREIHDMEKLLDTLPKMEPPATLRDEIVRKAPMQAAQPSSAGWLRKWLTPMQWDQALAYGASAAFGALLVTAIYESQPDFGDLSDITELVGAMAPDGGNDRTLLDRFAFDATGVASIAMLQQTEDALILDIRIDTDQLVEVVIDLAAAEAEFEALSQKSSHIETIEFSERLLTVKGRGQRRFSVLLRQRDDTPSTSEVRIDLEYSTNGALIRQGTLSATQ